MKVDLQELHPCYSEEAHSRYARIHLPVAELCNLGCNYCERLIGGPSYHSYRPAICDRVIGPSEALGLVEYHSRDQRLKVVGIAGPGEPLFNNETFQTLELVSYNFPELILCLSTNGILLPRLVQRLVDLGLSTITVTINTLDPQTAEEIYSYIFLDGEFLSGKEAARAIIANQIVGVRLAAKSGMKVKINTILMPGINDLEIGDIARASRQAGACIQNIVPLIPLGNLAHLKPPSCEELRKARMDGRMHIDQFTRCRQCRADSVGIPGKEDGRLFSTTF